MQEGDSWPPSGAGFGPSIPWAPAARREVRWGAAIAYGLGAAVVGGVGWGVIAAFTGYIFVWGGILVGLFVGWAIRTGGRWVSWGSIGLAVALTFLAVFIGDVVALSILASEFGATPVDVLVHYPEILAFAPGEAALTYVFGFIGVLAVAFWLRSQMKSQDRPLMLAPPAYLGPRPVGSPSVPAPMGAPAVAVRGSPAVEILSRGTKAAVRVTTTSPPHTLEAGYQTMTGAATVTLDGRPFTKVRVWGFEKVVDVPLGGDPPQRVSFRFYGVTPRIDVRVNGSIVGSV